MLFFIPFLFFFIFVKSNIILYDLPIYSSQTKWTIGKRIYFTLPEAFTVTGYVKNIQYFSKYKNSVFISGVVSPIPKTNITGTFSASFYKNFMNANVHYSGDMQYELRPFKDNKCDDPLKYTYIMKKVNMSKDYYSRENEHDDDDHLKTYLRKRMEKQQNIVLLNTVTLRVLVLYTKQAVLSVGNEDSLLATITLAIGNFNLALQNSLVNVFVDYVAERIQEYDTFVEDADMGTMLNRLGSSISTVRRNVLHCHAVQLVTQNTQYCGIADYAFNGLTSGYSATFYGCIGGYLSLAHEIGHNIGLHHDSSAFGGTTPNRGYCWDDSAGINNCHRSVMAYAGCVTPKGKTNCDRVKYFSAPQVVEMGNRVGVLNAYDNAQQFRNNIQQFMNQFTPSFISTPQPSVVISSLSPSLMPSLNPSFIPSMIPSQKPSIKSSFAPSKKPSSMPSTIPSQKPSVIPSSKPSFTPSRMPSAMPSSKPSFTPSQMPSFMPSSIPSSKPSFTPSRMPSAMPSSKPSFMPSSIPSLKPSFTPSQMPSAMPSSIPSLKPSFTPSRMPSAMPSSIPSSKPSFTPSQMPSFIPSQKPSVMPSSIPSLKPSFTPSQMPSTMPSSKPSFTPSQMPSNMPSSKPSFTPSQMPSFIPSQKPSAIPSQMPSFIPSQKPSAIPSQMPSVMPSQTPSSHPSSKPSANPTFIPSIIPSISPSVIPSEVPSTEPTIIMTYNPSTEPTVCNINSGECNIKQKTPKKMYDDYFSMYILISIVIALLIIFICIQCIIRFFHTDNRETFSSKFSDIGKSTSLKMADIYASTSSKLKNRIAYSTKRDSRTQVISYNSKFGKHDVSNDIESPISQTDPNDEIQQNNVFNENVFSEKDEHVTEKEEPQDVQIYVKNKK